MKKYVVLIVFVILTGCSVNLYSQIGWMTQQSGTTANINCISFVNNMTGWFCGSGGMIKKTTNGGVNWTAQASTTSYGLYALYFLNENTGWAAGGYIDINTWGNMVILKTTNGGINWITQANEITDFYYPNSFYFIDSNTGFAACQGGNGGGVTGCILKTTNGGVNWQYINGGRNSTKITFINSSTGFFISKVWNDIGTDSAIVYKTTNGGLNWYDCFRRNHSNFKNIVFFNQTSGIIQGDSSYYGVANCYYKTTDAGISWLQISAGNNYHSYSFFNNEQTGWAIGNQIYKTTNGGINWIANLPNTSSLLTCITFTDTYNGWSGGNNGALYRTTLTDTISGKYFPLQVGNVYKYYTWDFPYPNSGTYSKARIVKDTIANGNRYFYCKGFPSIQNGWVRYDSLSGMLLQLYPGNGCGVYANDKIIDSLTSRVNNTLNYCPYNSTSLRRCSDTLNITLFNYYTTKSKTFAHDGLIVSNVTYSRNIGISSYSSGEPPPISHYVNLKGCFVNGILYGDTLLTGINQISTEVPAKYSLGQNYPNPFNPKTVVRFSLSVVSDVVLKVYDVMGREVETLVNERLQAGTYEAQWNAEKYSSGVYFYRIITEGYSETKTMLLVK